MSWVALGGNNTGWMGLLASSNGKRTQGGRKVPSPASPLSPVAKAGPACKSNEGVLTGSNRGERSYLQVWEGTEQRALNESDSTLGSGLPFPYSFLLRTHFLQA